MTIIGIFYLAFLALILISFWKIYEKAGRKGWEGIIPIYNIYVMLQIVGKPGWWLIMYFIPIVNIVYAIWTYNMLSKSFGKDEGFTIGLVLLGIIFFPVLAFSDAHYLGPYGDRQAFQSYRQGNTFDIEQNKLA